MANVVADSNDPDVAAVFGEHTAGAAAVTGQSNKGRGVLGISEVGQGVFGISNGVFGITNAGVGVLGECKANVGVKGVSETGTGLNGTSKSGFGAAGESETATGVIGISNTGRGVEGRSNGVFGITNAGVGVLGECKANVGVKGVSETGTGLNGTSKSGFGAAGESETATGVIGISNTGRGVEGRSSSGIGVHGVSKSGPGVRGDAVDNGVEGQSERGVGVAAESNRGPALVGTTRGTDVSALIVNHRGTGNIIIGRNFDNAEVFRVTVSGDVLAHDVVLSGGDCAEEFDIDDTEKIEPGTVMVINETGALEKSQRAYDKRVAGVISGAGGYKPGIVLDKQHSSLTRKPIALLGKVYCKVDAQYSPIEVGDLLTTSFTPGHAMKADDPRKAFGTVIGKALRPLSQGQGLIPILIALQ